MFRNLLLGEFAVARSIGVKMFRASMKRMRSSVLAVEEPERGPGA